MGKIAIVANVPRVRKLFKGVKRVTVPNQCMSLHEMLRRFVRREPLPVEKEGVYIETDYDLEKLAHLDRVDQEEVLQEMKAKTQEADRKVKKAQKEKADKEALEAQLAELQQKDPKGDDPVKNPPPKGA